MKWLLIVVSVGYVGSLAVLVLRLRRLVFQIPTTERVAPTAAGFGKGEEHVLTTADGERVIVWHAPPKPGRAVILYFPGTGDFLAGRTGRFRLMTADGTGLVVLSYRGYAGSSGSPSERGVLQDAAAAYTFTSARYATDRIVVWGFSLGSGVAVALAAEQKIGKLILEAPYVSAVDAAAASSLLRFVPLRLLMRDHFRSDRRIGRVTAPLLIMHGECDTVFPIAASERLFALAHEPKQFVRLADGGHVDLDAFGGMRAARQFINAAKGDGRHHLAHSPPSGFGDLVR